ncbi:DUF397 domain-containing protein [Actinosynnema sp. NPDC020468]|uniref:DUF397 domain-containing protein n=1 Tax=Actinosynnema sp. NPDC020468 TaxID=3154488 RepID=UPI0033E798C8
MSIADTTSNGPRWRKSSYTSAGDPQCVELACVKDLRAVRDSKWPGGGTLSFSADAFRAFLADLRR